MPSHFVLEVAGALAVVGARLHLGSRVVQIAFELRVTLLHRRNLVLVLALELLGLLSHRGRRIAPLQSIS